MVDRGRGLRPGAHVRCHRKHRAGRRRDRAPSLGAGQTVRAVVRNPEKAAPWVKMGCDLAVADVLEAEALAKAFSGVEALFVLVPPLFDPGDGFPEIRAILDALEYAIEKARPGRVVCLSTVGAQVTRPNLLNQLALMEQRFGDLSSPVAFLRAAWFWIMVGTETITTNRTLLPGQEQC
jgi:NAD(P)H dehydrogenase (quinone)